MVVVSAPRHKPSSFTRGQHGATADSEADHDARSACISVCDTAVVRPQDISLGFGFWGLGILPEIPDTRFWVFPLILDIFDVL